MWSGSGGNKGCCLLSLPLFLLPSFSFDYLISQDMAGQMINKFALCKLITTAEAAAAKYSFFTLSAPDTTNTHPSHPAPSISFSLSVCVSQSS